MEKSRFNTIIEHLAESISRPPFPLLTLVNNMDDNEIRSTVRRVLSETALLDVPLDTLDDRADLYGAGLASVTSVCVMVAIEDEFRIEIPDRLLTRNLFQNIDSLTSAVNECLNANAQANHTS